MAEGLIGRTLLDGEYRLIAVLGRGGMATVYRAYSRSLDTDVAIKVLAPRLAADPTFRERHHDEARSLAGLHHPNLVEVHHYAEEADLVYIAMRLVPGGTLKNRLEAVGGPLDVTTTARLVAQVADALQLAHERGLIHLDIKPANILLGRADWPLLADFGITRAISRDQTSRGGERMAGTPLYMSPEQCRGDSIDGRSDQYSLAITAYEMLTGRRPFQAETTEAVLQRQIEDPPPRPREVNPGIPGPVEDVLMRALSKSPDDRYPTVRDFADALSQAAERTRGVTLETKAALANVAPNLLGIVGLILLGPVVLAMLPSSGFFSNRVPVIWPFQLIVSTLIALLIVSMRWPLIGLLTRALGGLVDAILVVSSGGTAFGSAATHGSAVKKWRNSVAGSAEGVVDLACVFVGYRLIAVPALAILAALVAVPVNAIATMAVTALFVVVSLVIVLCVYRHSGAVVASLILATCWAAASAAPTMDATARGGVSVAWTVKAVVGVGVILLLLVSRSRLQTFVRRAVEASVAPLVAELQPGADPDVVVRSRSQIGSLGCGVVDFLYLLVAYALLRGPLVDGLGGVALARPVAIAVSGAAVLIWLVLTLRLNWIAGTAGLALGLLLGSSMLLTLPVLREQVLGASWPATVVGWCVGTILILVLAALRAQARDVSGAALGQRFDRGLLGTSTAPDEESSDRRVSALAGVGEALVDVAILVIAYWALGVPAATAIDRASGRPGSGSVFLAVLVVAVIAILWRPVTHAASTVEETGGASWSGRLRTIPGIVVALVSLLVASCAAAPVALAAPTTAGNLAVGVSQAPTVSVDWEHWLPWTPSQDQATYEIELSCPDGQTFGPFREAYHPSRPGDMPSGVGRLGPTGITCDNWSRAYFDHRRAAGLPDTPSVSWDWVDVKAIVNPIGSVDVAETHHVLFTFGSFSSLTWNEPSGTGAGQITNLSVSEDGTIFPLNPAQPQNRYARIWEQDGHPVVGWWFPSVSSPTERIFTIRYRLNNAITVSGGRRHFEREILSPSRQGPSWRATVEVILPGTFATNQIQLRVAGAPARTGLPDARTASFESRDVPVGTGLDVAVDFPVDGGAGVPTAAMTATLTPTATPLGGNADALGATGSTPSATPTLEATATPTEEASATPTATDTATASPTVSSTATPTATMTPVTPTATSAATSTPTRTPTTAARSCAPVPVLAMYYAWYDMNTWTSGKTSDQPVAPYVSADRSTIERQVTQAQSLGINGFELNWWGPGNQTDTNLQTLLSVAGAHGFKVTVDFDLNSPSVHNAGDITNALKYLKHYFADPSWFRYNGKPYVVFFGTRKFDVNTWGTILHEVDPNHEVTWIAEGDIFSYLTVFDGIHPYSIAWSSNPSGTLASYASRTRAYPGKIWMATVMPGYNDTLVNGAQGFAVDRQNGAYYTRMWDGAIATHPEVISITSWNEWVEGSYIEASQKYGDLFLQLTRQMVQKYHSYLVPCG